MHKILPEGGGGEAYYRYWTGQSMVDQPSHRMSGTWVHKAYCESQAPGVGFI